MSKKYLSLEEAAERLGLSTEQLVRARENGDIRGFADRGSWKFREQDVTEYARTQQADSDPEVQMLGDSVLSDDDDQDLGTSDSDVRLMVDDGLLPSDDLAESTSDVRLTGDSGPFLDSSDSDVQLVGSDSDSDVRLSDSDSDVRITNDDSDSDVELVADSDSDVKLLDDDSDSDVQLIEGGGLDQTEQEIILSDSGSSAVLDGDDESGKPDESSLILGESDSDVALTPDSSAVNLDPGSDITLEADDSSAVALEADDDSGITLDGYDSGVLLGADDSGISLESIDSGLVLDGDDSGISLDAADSGISLEAADSGIALAPEDDSGIGLAPQKLDSTMPMMSGMEPVQESLDTTHMDVPGIAETNDSDFELAGLGDDDDDPGTDTSVLLFEDADESEDTAHAVVEEPVGVDSAEVIAESDEFDQAFDDDELEMDDDFDDDMDVFDAADDDFEEDFDAGESQVDFAPQVARAAGPAYENEWGVGWLVSLSVGSVLMVACCMLSFDLVRSMWAWNEPTPVSNVLLETLGGLFTSS